MKNSLLFIFLLLFAFFSSVNGQNLVLNPGFENWDDPAIPTDWEKAESVTQESSVVHTGTYSAKQVGGTKDIAQTIAVTAGTTYKISMWYYIESGDGTDARIWSYWRDATGTIDDNAAELRGPNNSYFPDEKGAWKNYEVVLEAPAIAVELYLEVRVYGAAVVYWDDFLVEEFTPTGSLELTSPNGGESYNAGQSVQFGWNSTGVSSVYFEVWTDESLWEPITGEIASVDGANTYDFTIPANAWTWDGYKIRVIDALIPSILDESDAAFSIDGHDTELFYEDFSTGNLNNFETISVIGTAVWGADTYGGVTYAKASGYNLGQTETWLISPAVNLDNTTNEIIEFMTASNYSGDDIVVKYSTNYDGGGDPSTATWNEFVDYTLSAGSFEWTKSGYLDLSSLSGNVSIAFIYTCSVDAAKTWEVTDIYISGKDDPSTGIKPGKETDIKVMPNPFTTELRVMGDNVSGIALYNAAGQLVKEAPYAGGTISTASLNKGMYILQIKMADGTIKTQKVIKK